MLKKLLILFLTVIMIFSFTSCAEKNAKDLFDELGFSLETLSSWEGEIKYIKENRGSFDDTYTKVKYDPENPNTLLQLINCFEGAQATDSPDAFVFSAEGMSEYIINFYVDEQEEPILSFYYFKDENILTRVLRSFDEKRQVDIVEYEFFTPYGDLNALVTQFRQIAVVPKSEHVRLSLNQKQLIASVEEEELAERMTYFDDEYEVQEDAEMGEIPFEIYGGTLPDDEGTGCKLYDNTDIEELADDELVLLGRIADEKGEPMELLVTFVEYNTVYTIVTISYPDKELMAEFNLEVDSAIKLKKEDIDKDNYIVFLDDEGTVVYVVVPFMG